MRSIRVVLVAVAVLLVGGVVVAQATTVSPGTYIVTLRDSRILADGSAVFALRYVNASGQQASVRQLSVDAAGSQVIDDNGNVVATPAPAALLSAISSFNAQINSLIAAGATAGKLVP